MLRTSTRPAERDRLKWMERPIEERSAAAINAPAVASSTSPQSVDVSVPAVGRRRGSSKSLSSRHSSAVDELHT